LVFTRGAEGQPVYFTFGRRTLWGLALLVAMLFAFLSYGTVQYLRLPPEVATLKAKYQSRLAEVNAERKALRRDIAKFRQARESMESAMQSLGRQVGIQQAKMARLDALGERIVNLADLEAGEFNFEQQPALGGPDGSNAGGRGGPRGGEQDFAELAQMVDQLSARIADRSGQLELLHDVLDHKQVREKAKPEGWPTSGGWLSSHFGRRIDPFTGKPAIHEGVDIANREGAKVEALAPGVVTWAGERYGYGKMVEIDHGNGYRTRYGHNHNVQVSVGERVQKGDVVSHVGNTGRSTGPHIHLEVLKNGEQIDPARYLEH
jgi:murein DD-endopeptidase MepM/ murein hydrolase activator NlpD